MPTKRIGKKAKRTQALLPRDSTRSYPALSSYLNRHAALQRVRSMPL